MDADVREIAHMVWEAVFDLDLEPSDDAVLDDDVIVTSFVLIDGAWEGVVMVQCPLALAVSLTASMFEGDAGVQAGVGEAEVRDAMGEVVNMVAGNIKALLPMPCHTSLPAVALGHDDTVSVPGITPTTTVAFTCDGHPFVVTILESAP